MRQKKGVGDQTTAQSFWPFTSHATFLSCRLSHTLLFSIQRFYMSASGHLKPIMAPVKVFTELHIFFESLGRSFFKKHLCEVWSHRFFKFIFFQTKGEILYTVHNTLSDHWAAVFTTHSVFLSIGSVQQNSAAQCLSLEKYEMPDPTFLSCRITELTQLQTNNCSSIFPACLRVIDRERQRQNQQ